tara:strand:- start:1349 stop:2467 length:1119 start_codon:yes stop_codon:yes gene_type:complete
MDGLNENLIPQVSLAEVQSAVDPTNIGMFQATIVAESNQIRSVIYVTPYASNEAGAFIAIPEVGVQVLVCKPTGADSWYYLGATFLPPPKESTGSPIVENVENTPLQIASPKLKSAKGVPMRMQWTGTQGGGMHIIEEKNSSMMNEKVEIHSSVGKSISLNDNPLTDAIVLESGNGTSIKITDNPQNLTDPSRAVLIETEGPQKYINNNASTDVVVIDGGELQLLNNSTGLMSTPLDPVGNVNIQSKWKDVNIFTKGFKGRIFIKNVNSKAVNPIIEISTQGVGGGVNIITTGKAKISAVEGIDIDTLGPINMRGSSINMEATAGGVNIKALGNTSLQGATIQLNPPAPLPPVLPDIGVNLDAYLGFGITTY